MDVSLLLADAASDNMAAFCHQAGCSDCECAPTRPSGGPCVLSQRTNGLSVFSVFVFKPTEPRPLFSQKAVCSGKVTGAAFGPRDDLLDSCQESSQWLNCSNLYFLTANTVGSVTGGPRWAESIVHPF